MLAVPTTRRARFEIESKTDGYIASPGRALVFMVDRCTSCACRWMLGDRFDIRDFHDAVLVHGALPSVLEDVVRR